MVSERGLPLGHLLDSAPDGFVVVNAEGVIVWANQTAHQLFGYGDAGLPGRKIEELVPERLRQGHVAHRDQYSSASRIRPMGLGLNLLGRKQDGSEFPIEISLSPVQTAEGLLVTAVVRDVTERRRLEEERNRLEGELKAERERDRIAMDLHDGIMQDIYAVALGLELALEDADGHRQADAAAVEHSIDQLHDVVRNIRSLIFDLRPREFVGSLPDALANLTQEFNQNSQIETELKVEGDTPVDFNVAVALYHIAHEGLSNIRKHARARHARVGLQLGKEVGVLEVCDDGAGFDAAVTPPEGHHGMRNMVARTHAVGGAFSVESSAGGGTRLRVTFPVAGAAQASPGNLRAT